MNFKLAFLPGDGIGYEIIEEADRVLQAVGARFGHTFKHTLGRVGGRAIMATGDPYPPETDKLCKESDAVLFGAVGDPRFDGAKVRPEQGLLRMRRSLGLFANLRPVELLEGLVDRSPLRNEVVRGTDFVFVRELTGGIYFGERGRDTDENGDQRAFDTCVYTAAEIDRIVRMAFDLAMKRRRKLTVVDKANVLETSRLWRERAAAIAPEFPEVAVDYMYVDNAAMQIVTRPTAFDVVVTDNMFGDILSDEASVISGSLGMLPSASIGTKYALFEPIHGSYPEATEKYIANPMASILSAAMMLDHFGLDTEAAAVRNAVNEAIRAGVVTQDLAKKGEKAFSTWEVGTYVAKAV